MLPLLRGAGVETHAVTLTGVGERTHLLSPAIGIDGTNPPLTTIDAARKRVRSEPDWTVHEPVTGHDPMRLISL